MYRTAYSKWYNKTYKRAGPLYNGRFKNFTCKSVPYFFYIIDYIHCNGKKHAKLKTYNYKYSSYKNFVTQKGLCDLKPCFEFLNMSRDEVMNHLESMADHEDLPVINQFIEMLKKKTDKQTVKEILCHLEFAIEDFRKSRVSWYFNHIKRSFVNNYVKLRQSVWSTLQNCLMYHVVMFIV